MAVIPPYIAQTDPYVRVDGFGPVEAERELRHVEGLLMAASVPHVGEQMLVIRRLLTQHQDALLDIGHGNRTG